MPYVLAIILTTTCGTSFATNTDFMSLQKQTSNRTVWVMAKRLWLKWPATRRLIWNETNVTSNVVSTILASSSGHWVTKQATAITSWLATNGLRRKTLAVRANTNKQDRRIIPTYFVRCITDIQPWKSTANALMPPSL